MTEREKISMVNRNMEQEIAERRKMAEALRTSEEKYRLLAENASDIIFTMDENLRFTYISPAVMHLRGYSVEEAMAQSPAEALTPASLEKAVKYFADEMKIEREGSENPNRARVLELEETCKDGSTRWMESTFSPLRNHENRLIGFLGISRDITDRRRMEMALHESEERYREITKCIPDLIWTMDLSGRFTYVNSAVLRTHGWTVEEFLKLDRTRLFSPEQAAANAATLEEILERASDPDYDRTSVVTYESEELRKDGSTFWAEITATFLLSDDGNPRAIIGITRDITERKRLETALHEREELYRTALESSNDGVAIIQDGRYVYANTQILYNIGRSWDELISSDLSSMVHPDDRESVISHYQKNMEGIPTPNHLEIRIMLPDGGVLHADVSMVKVTYQGENAILLYARNITERKQAEKEREMHISQLRQALSDVKTLSGLLPICASCKKIRDDQGYWNQIEAYIGKHSDAQFSHGICPDCAQKLYPDILKKVKGGPKKMEGWTEDEIKDQNLMAPCGLYCGACGVYIATRDQNEKFKKVMGDLYGTKPEDTQCLGCMQQDPPKKLYGYCATCAIRDCVRGKGYYSCHQCDQWPCGLIENFGLATGRRVMKRAIPIWRAKVADLGNEKGSVEWARAELERYHCRACGKPLFRGAKRCRACKADVTEQLDGTL